MEKYQLSLPGPTECDPEVLMELNRPNLPHYGKLWIDFYWEVLGKLKKIYQTNGTVYIIPSSGSGGLDAVFTSLYGKKGLVLNNGTFGERIASIASRYLQDITIIKKEPGESFDLNEVKEYLEKGSFDLLAVVQGETSTGMLNPLKGLSKICKERDILFVVDAVSTLGGVELSVDGLGIDFCISASQKALGSIPGLATISISDRGWKCMANEEDIPGWYLNLKTWGRFEKDWGDWHPYPVTLPVHLYFALNKAFDIILEEGLVNRWLRHKNVANLLHEGLAKLGISPFVKDKALFLPTVTSAILPGELTSEALQDYLRENFGILIAGGVGPLRKKVFRIGHMAYSAQERLVKRTLSGIEKFINDEK